MTDNITIRHRYTDAVLLEYQPTAEQQESGLAMRAALETAVACGANLRWANLRGASLSGAQLGWANLDGASLRRAQLGGANLRGAQLDGANLDGAQLDGANLRGASLCGASLSGASLSGAQLGGANLDGAYLDGAQLDGANLRGASLGGAHLDGANLDGAQLDDKKLIGKRPILMIGPIGSRADYFTAYMTDAGVYLRTGCFFGSVDKFRAALKGEHGDNEHAHEYAAALELIACHARLWAQECEAADVAAEGAA